MNRHTFFARISLLLASIFGSIDVASGSWLVTDGEPGKVTASESLTTNTTRAVCYIKETGVYYTSLDRALYVAERERPNDVDTICVIPNLKKTDGTTSPIAIKNDHIIKSGDSLILPYAYKNSDNTYTYIACDNNIETGEAIADTIKNEKGEADTPTINAMLHGSGSETFADESEDAVNTYRQTKVVLNTGVTLTVNGSLLIGGKLSKAGTGVSGQTSGSYCEIVLSNNSSIVCSGSEANIKCDGYIKRAAKENGSTLQVMDGGTLLSPLVIYDYKGGSCSYAATMSATNKFSPFYIYDFPNIQVATQVKYGSYWNCKTWLYAKNAFWPITDLYFIAPSDSDVSPIMIHRSGSISVDYVPADESNAYTSSGVDGTKTSIEVTGIVDIGRMNFTYAFVTIDSSIFYLPISYRLSLTLKSGTDESPSIMNVPNKVKFMNGSSVTIEKGATVNVTAPIAIYGKDFEDKAGGTSIHYPVITKDGKAVGSSFVNNGTLKVSGNGVIGGFIDTTSTDGTASIEYGVRANSISSPEPDTYSGEGLSSTVTMANYTCSATGNLSSDSGKNFTEGGNIVYSSVAYDSVSGNGKSGWGLISKIVGVSITEISDSSTQDMTAGTVQVKAEIDPAYLTGVNYVWSLPDCPDSGLIYIEGNVEGNGATATITNKTDNEVEVTVSVTASYSESSSSNSYKVKVNPKKQVAIPPKVTGFGYTIKSYTLEYDTTTNKMPATPNLPVDSYFENENATAWTGTKNNLAKTDTVSTTERSGSTDKINLIETYYKVDISFVGEDGNVRSDISDIKVNWRMTYRSAAKNYYTYKKDGTYSTFSELTVSGQVSSSCISMIFLVRNNGKKAFSSVYLQPQFNITYWNNITGQEPKCCPSNGSAAYLQFKLFL